MTLIVRPMLAATLTDIDTLKFPVLASPKLDGIRCLIVGDRAVTRKFKPIPNRIIRTWLEANVPEGMDGELIIKGATFNETQSQVMSEFGNPNFEFWAFDRVALDLSEPLSEPFDRRYVDLRYFIESQDIHVQRRLKLVPHVLIDSPLELRQFEQECLDDGYEGVMIRTLNGPYKCGRSTLKQGWLLKLKRFQDSEATIIGFKELQTNQNTQSVDEFGLTKRSSHKAGKIGISMLGAFQVQDVKSGQVFDIGTGEGLTRELRQEVWRNQSVYLGTLVKYKYQAEGQKDLPRFPVWLGFRDERD